MDHVLMEEDYFCVECNCGYEYAYGYATVYIEGVEYPHDHTEKATMADFREEHDAYRRARHRAMAAKLADWNLSSREGGD